MFPSQMPGINQLRKYQIFSNLSGAELEKLAACLVKRTFAKGAYLFYPGNPSLSLYLVESGLLRLFFANSRGEEFLLNLIYPGECVGLPLLPDDQVRLSGAAAQQDTVVFTLAREDAFKFMQSSPQFMHNIYLELSSGIRKLTLYAQVHTMLGIGARLASLFLYQALNHQHAGTDEIELPLNQTEIASWVGSSRGQINRALNKMQHANLIRIEGQKVFIRDLPGLTKMADGLITYWV